MKNSTKLIAGILIAMPLGMGAAWAGPSTSGGGFAVVCRAPEGKIQSAELLDLFEARTNFGFELLPTTSSFEDDYVASAKNTYSLQGAKPDIVPAVELKENLGKFMKIVRFTRAGEKLPATRDLGKHASAPQGCAIEQAAIFDDVRTSVHIDSEIWNALPHQSRAALAQHELFYHHARRLNEATSESTRALVAHIFSNQGSSQGPVPVKTGVPAGAKSVSANELANDSDVQQGTYFHTYELSGKSVLQFTSIAGQPVVSRMLSAMPLVSWDLKTIVRGGRPVAVVREQGMNLRNVRVPVTGSLRNDLEISMTYVTGEPVTLEIYRAGLHISSAVVSIASVPTPPSRPGPKPDMPPPVRKVKLGYSLKMVTTFSGRGRTEVKSTTICEDQNATIDFYEIRDGQNALPKAVAVCPALIKGEIERIEVIAALANLMLSNRPHERIFKTYLRSSSISVGADDVGSDLQQTSGEVRFERHIDSFVMPDGRNAEERIVFSAKYED